VIHDLAFGGEGVARLAEFVVFVPFVLPGERVEVEVTEVKKRYARGRLLRVLAPAAARVTPPCPYFGECGGCQYQHMDYGAQVALKRKQVQDLLQRIGGCPGTVVTPVIPCPRPYGYRNRIMVRTQWDKFKQGLNLGFVRHDSRLVVDIESCRIAEPAVNEQLRQLRQAPPPRGGLKVVLRQSPPDWEVPPDSFFQNNFPLLPRLAEVVRDRLRQGGVRHLVDAYCGVGFFSLVLADLVESFVGVELDRLAVRAARRNAAARGCANGEFQVDRVEACLPSLLQQFAPDRTAVILDPPRTGCAAGVIAQLRAARPAQVIYVSCHPATLGRDLNALAAGGVYSVVGVQPLDMFPQTQHIECVADLRAQSAV
jgi:tRNA/tmRNA/rRNA uracil-C5-methylase (TrmA/RlmC/RlmD family)